MKGKGFDLARAVMTAGTAPARPRSPLLAPAADVSEARTASHVDRAATTAAAVDPRPRRRATYTRPHGVRYLFAVGQGEQC